MQIFCTAAHTLLHSSFVHYHLLTSRSSFVLLFFISPGICVSLINVVFLSQTLAALFTPYGTVTHGVILATLDGASRRRGFVVMSTHEEAKRAMTALGRNGKGGGGLDISWAVVQRSKGMLSLILS